MLELWSEEKGNMLEMFVLEMLEMFMFSVGLNLGRTSQNMLSIRRKTFQKVASFNNSSKHLVNGKFIQMLIKE